MSETQTENKKLYAGKYETPEALEEGYNNSVKGYQDLAQKKKDAEDRVNALESKEKSHKEALENGRKEMGDNYNQLEEFVKNSYPIGTHEAIMDTLAVYKTARDIMIKEREAKLNTTTPGVNNVSSQNSATISKDDLIELAKALHNDPENRFSETATNKLIAAAKERANQLGITDNSLCIGPRRGQDD